MQPILIAKTARAGEYNHRYLVPVQNGYAESEIYAIAQRATGRVCGPDFLAAYRQVTQAKGGRTGEEAIILAGIDTAALGERQKIILTFLEGLLTDLEHLVTEEFDWNQRASDRMLVDCESLNLWMRRLKETLVAECRDDASLPPYVSPTPISPPQDQQPTAASTGTPETRQRQPYGLMASIGVICLVIGGVVGWQFASALKGHGGDQQPTENELPQLQADSDQDTQDTCIIAESKSDCSVQKESLELDLNKAKKRNTQLDEENTRLNSELRKCEPELLILKEQLKLESDKRDKQDALNNHSTR